MNIKDWLVPMLKRYYLETKRFDRDAGPKSYLGKAKEELGGYGQGAVRQHFKEVRSREGLRVRRAFEGLPFQAKEVLDAHYTQDGRKAREKAKDLGLSEARYWTVLDCAYFYLAGRIDSIESQVVETTVNLVLDIARKV